MKTSPRFQIAFTLVELMVSTAIIGLIMFVLVAMTNQTSRTWQSTTEKIEKFQEARDGFEAMTRRLSQATLNTYWDYLDKNGVPRGKIVTDDTFKKFIPFMYGRASDLRFASGPMFTTYAPAGVTPLAAIEGPASNTSTRIRPTHGIFFVAPFGVVNTDTSMPGGNPTYGVMNNLLNTWGYFVEADEDASRPGFLDPAINPQAHVLKRWRSRLMEYMLPAQQMAVFNATDTSYKWFSVFLPIQQPNSGYTRPVHALAENVIALIIQPKLSAADQDVLNQYNGGTPVLLSANYAYDSTKTVNPGPNAYAGANAVVAASVNPKNQLPPIVSVTMVAVDERSAERLFDRHCTPYDSNGAGGPSRLSPSEKDATMGLSEAVQNHAAEIGVSGLGDLFQNALSLEIPNTGNIKTAGDLEKLQYVLTKEGCTYRVFTTNVTIRGAKWSRSQTK